MGNAEYGINVPTVASFRTPNSAFRIYPIECEGNAAKHTCAQNALNFRNKVLTGSTEESVFGWAIDEPFAH
jgi:hypothetical protein